MLGRRQVIRRRFPGPGCCNSCHVLENPAASYRLFEYWEDDLKRAGREFRVKTRKTGCRSYFGETYGLGSGRGPEGAAHGYRRVGDFMGLMSGPRECPVER